MRKHLSVVVAGSLLCAVVAGAADGVSFRLRGMGTDLSRFIDDDYTDIMANPACLSAIENTWILSNLSNMTGGTHQFLDYGYNSYSGSSGRYLVGAFMPRGGLAFGVIADCWNDDSWETAGYGMDTDMASYTFDWESATSEAGSWTDRNESGNYTVAEEREGLEVIDDDRGVNVSAMAGTGGAGLRYDFTYTQSNDPSEWSGTRTYLSHMTHSYRLTEDNASAVLEAETGEQTEINEFHCFTQQHSLTAGMVLELSGGAVLDGTAGIHFIHDKDASESRRRKDIDYDPDGDGVSSQGTYGTYRYLAYDSYSGTSFGLGYSLSSRYRRPLPDNMRLSVLFDVRFTPRWCDDYEVSGSEAAMMTDIGSNILFSSSDGAEMSGEWNEYDFGVLAGAGLELRPAPGLIAGLGAKWSGSYQRTVWSLDDDDGTSESTGEYGSTYASNILSLPLGAEYSIRDRYFFRLGATSSFIYYGTSEVEDEVEDSGFLVARTDVRSEEADAYNVTRYSYGFGFAPGGAFSFDLTGITDLVDLSNVYVSVNCRY